MNPVALERRSVAHSDERFLYRSIYTWCPGCHSAHPFRVELGPECPPRADGTPEPVWSWDGNLEAPTFEPSMLAHGSVHICADEHPYGLPCADPEACGNPGHLILDGDVRGHPSPHTRDPAWGDCHSFLRAGVWEFLTDSAHPLAGQRVPMVPLPDWLI